MAMTIRKHGIIWLGAIGLLAGACQSSGENKAGNEASDLQADTLQPTIVTEKVAHDSDDPAIWINKADPQTSLILGTDKDSDGALYAFDLEGKIVKRVGGLKRPNNVDVAQAFGINGDTIAIAVLTEREANKIRVFRLPELEAIDGGGISVFDGEAERDPMGIALFTRPADQEVFAVVGRKSGPATDYLWQYRLKANANGVVTGELVRKFGAYSGKKEIEAIVVDNELGYVYYSDEQHGVRKYLADPDEKDNTELAVFAREGFKDDHEGIAIYKTGDSTGYLLISNQAAHTLMVYPRESRNGDHDHPLLAEIPVKAMETDGVDASAVALGDAFPEGLVVSMSTDQTFHFYDWRTVLERIKVAQQ